MRMCVVAIQADRDSQNGQAFMRVMRCFGRPYADAVQDDNPSCRLPFVLEPLARRVLATRMGLDGTGADDAGYSVTTIQ